MVVAAGEVAIAGDSAAVAEEEVGDEAAVPDPPAPTPNRAPTTGTVPSAAIATSVSDKAVTDVRRRKGLAETVAVGPCARREGQWLLVYKMKKKHFAEDSRSDEYS